MRNKLIHYTLTLSILTASLSACRFDGKKHVPKELIPGVEKRAVHVLTPSEIISEGMRQGQLIIDSLQDSLSSQLLQLASEDSLVYWQDLAKADHFPLKDSLAQDYNVQISYRDAENPPEDSVLNNLWEAYQYNAAQGLSMEDNIQQLHGTERFLFTRAIALDSSLVHQLRKVQTPTAQKVADSLADTEDNGLVGVWVVHLQKKYVIAHYVVPADKQKL